MAVRPSRFPVSRVVSTVVGETRLAARAAPSVARYLFPIAAWAVASIVLGVVVGLCAVYLPPMGSFGIVAAAAVILLWVMPDLPLVSRGFIRKAFLVMLVADLIVPFYYTIQVSGLPWISARRVATFLLIVPFLIAVAASSDVRRQITERLRESLMISVCVLGYLAIATLSILTSMNPTESMSSLVEAILSWYVPFFAMIYIVKDNDDVIYILKIICFCSLFNSIAGIIEFRLQHNFFIQIFPSGMFSSLLEANPSFSNLLPGPGHYRNGMYRADSTFVTPLSFGEFETIIIPIALFFAVHRKSIFDRTLGWAAVVFGVLGIFSSGSRGGWVGLITACGAFVTMWSIRKAMNNKASLAPAAVGMIGFIFFTMVGVLVTVWRRAHNIVLGGADTADSTQARFDQWSAGIPRILSNPITGHGFAMGGNIINDYTIDSYALSLVLETGVPGLLFFTGLLLLPIWSGVRNYFSDMSETGALSGALACSFLSFTQNRLVLSQRENHMLIFSLLAIVIVLNYEYARARKRVPKSLGPKSPQTAYPIGRVAPGSA